ncbi:MAG: CDP-alcohol phosphatidyltransferase family protein [Acidilobaceae archaeon]
MGRLFYVVGLLLSRFGVHPNYFTVAGLLLALFAPVAAYFGFGLVAIVLMSLSALFDVLDGLVARVSGLVSRVGAFLDSFSDRVSDASYILVLGLLGVDFRLCYMLLALSFLVSYARARGEGLGLVLKGVGLVERQERVLALIVISIVALYNLWLATIMVVGLVILTFITVAQRVMVIVNSLKSS